MLDIVGQAMQGIDAGFKRLDGAAQKIARQGASDNLASNLVEMTRARHEVRANTAVVRTADDMIGSLLDVLA